MSDAIRPGSKEARFNQSRDHAPEDASIASLLTIYFAFGVAWLFIGGAVTTFCFLIAIFAAYGTEATDWVDVFVAITLAALALTAIGTLFFWIVLPIRAWLRRRRARPQ